ncbi:hypothetical protein BDZ94DRAFT_761573 [Collybia nuda]|uniref:Uncharacterized protein n=1 Tax=Collybia nuda TaxID=64659 RepID=A0A9P6CIP3_9AGAR|nr:hypothetical protein BDZ94DRAFT_761573 [Collybia nuda]
MQHYTVLWTNLICRFGAEVLAAGPHHALVTGPAAQRMKLSLNERKKEGLKCDTSDILGSNIVWTPREERRARSSFTGPSNHNISLGEQIMPTLAWTLSRSPSSFGVWP